MKKHINRMLHKGHLTILILSLLFTVTSAQINLREGIVITLGGDTLSGMIDYRTDAINAQQCVFMANGASAATTYKPGEIAGYRFLDNGRYYVSREIPMPDGTNRMMFLEYVLSGQMSLYYRSSDSDDFFYLEDGIGTLAILKDIPDGSTRTERRKNMAQAIAMLYPCRTAQELLWEKGTSLANVIRVVRTYNDEVCPDGTCELFQYKSAKTPQADRIRWHLTAQIGYGYFSVSDEFEHCSDRYDPEANKGRKVDKTTHWATNYAIQSAFGAEFYCPRISPQLLVQLRLSLIQLNLEERETYTTVRYSLPYKVLQTDVEVKSHKKTFDILTIKAGPAYEWHRWQYVRPRIGGGLTMCNLYPLGVYASTGICFPTRKGEITCDADFNTYIPPFTVDKIIYGSISLGYQF